MRNPENAFDLELHKTHIDTLKESGLKVFTGSYTKENDGSLIYYALVIQEVEYIEKINEMNAARLTQWRINARKAYSEGKDYYDFERLDDLPENILLNDPRYQERPAAWDALSASEEIATKLLDNAPPELYYDLNDTPDKYDD